MPASASARSRSGSPDAGPIVATIFVRRRAAPFMRLRLATGSGEGAPPRILGSPAELFLGPQELVVLRDAVAARRRASLDLPRVRRDREVGDRRVLGLAGAVRDDDAVPSILSEADRLQRLRQGSDLVDLHEDR